MFWILFATRLSLPMPVDSRRPGSVFYADDMPDYVRQQGITRFVSTRTTVRPDGKLQEYGAERSSGDPALDAYTCSLILKRAKVEPAKWLDGSPAYGVLRLPVTWAIIAPPTEKETRAALPPDLELTIGRLPRGAYRRVRVDLMVAIDENGKVVACDQRPATSIYYHPKRFPELVPIACQQIMSRFTAIPAKDSTGKPVRSVQNAFVDFTTGRN